MARNNISSSAHEKSVNKVKTQMKNGINVQSAIGTFAQVGLTQQLGHANQRVPNYYY